MYDQLDNAANKPPEPPLSVPGATPDAGRAEQSQLPEPPHSPYANLPPPGPPYEPYKDI